MVDKLKVINFLQDFGCARLDQLQKLYNAPEDNFKSILSSNMVSKKGNVFVHNTKTIDNNILVALDHLCKYKGRFKQFHKGYMPVNITFLSKDNLLYHIIVVEDGNEQGILKTINACPPLLPKADRLILAFKNRGELDKIKCEIPYLYCIYPSLEIVNK